MKIFDPRACILGEGVLWHPQRSQLFWFDIIGKKLMSRTQDGQETEASFEHYVSAAGWIDASTLLIASSVDLRLYNIETGTHSHLHDLEHDNPMTRSNDGRADPYGGFWIGTMGVNLESGAGAIYRYYRGQLKKLFDGISIPNSICFSTDGKFAYFTDTPTRKIMRQSLDTSGWPIGEAELFIDLNKEGLNPDGSVIDQDDCLWNAQWGASQVSRYSPEGQLIERISCPALQPSCPAFGGAEMNSLFVTTAAEGLQPDAKQGRVYTKIVDVVGQPEHQIKL